MNNKLNKRKIMQLWLIQFAFTALLAALFGLSLGLNAAVSALLGGLVCIIPNVCFAIRLFKFQGAGAAKQIVRSFYQGEALKIITSVFLFTTVFILCRINPLAFFVSYIAVLMMHWFSPLVLDLRKGK